MSGPLALVGGGEWTEGCTFDQSLLAESGVSEVAVLPTGSAYENPSELIGHAREWFAGLGVEVREVPVLTRRDVNVAEYVDALRAARFIYLVGSSPMHLRSVLKDSPVWDALSQAWADGAVLVGSAAGADVICDPMVDTRGGAFTVGLALLQGLSVIPRFDRWSPEKVHRTVELAPPGLVLVGIPEATALVRATDGSWRSEGVGDVVVYRGGQSVGMEALP